MGNFCSMNPYECVLAKEWNSSKQYNRRLPTYEEKMYAQSVIEKLNHPSGMKLFTDPTHLIHHPLFKTV